MTGRQPGRRAPGRPPAAGMTWVPRGGYGLFDMAGNVWEWTSDYYTTLPAGPAQHACCAPRNPRVTSPEAGLDPGGPGGHIPRRVTKGGSHLCAPNYCLRYRPAARQGQAVDSSTCHMGFRCIIRDTKGARMNEKPAGNAARPGR